MLEIELSVDLASRAEDVWDVVGNFNGLPDWHPWVVASVLEPAAGGVGRRVTIAGGAAGLRELTERLVSYDASRLEYAYTVIAGSVPFAGYVGRFRVVPNGPGSCALKFRGRFRAAPGHTDVEATERIRTFYEAGLENLPVLFGSRSGVGPRRRPDRPRIDPAARG